jgi:hypothetical protein
VSPIPARVKNAIQEVADTAFACGEWNRDDSDESYDDVHGRHLTALAELALRHANHRLLAQSCEVTP